MPVKPVACCVVGKDVQLSARHGTAILVENNHVDSRILSSLHEVLMSNDPQNEPNSSGDDEPDDPQNEPNSSGDDEPDFSGQSAGSMADRMPKIIPFEQLARCGEEIWIECSGQIYRLRRTRQGKLILTK